MSVPTRILVKLVKSGIEPKLADFSECILNYFGLTSGSGSLYVELKDNYLIISDVSQAGSDEVAIQHPTFCPMLHLSLEAVSLPDEISTRGVDVGASILLESSDGKILLSKRARHLRIFPGLWVPPGGHIEENETMLEAGLRELKEETGLNLKPSDCLQNKIYLLALWESVYPPKLSVGPPVRHHIVVYFHAKLLEDLTAEVMERRINFEPGEVDSCAWLDRDIVSAIAQSFDEDYDEGINNDHLPKSFRALVLDENQKQIFCDLPTEPLVRILSASADDKERVSTGTKFALQKLLQFEADLL
ncbi:unnamed protein product [Candidula unifasciata]|uniref:m7GpppN-mRNA hydrolase NUDT17 n=1 Tax=Candidula unifasciata TaxID=100452 RepID=A0A8S3Z7V4_9EUPU|nr:unnamed protein product [Candidula unifasciata]